VADEVQREVERSDGHDDAARHPEGEGDLAGSAGSAIHGDGLAVNPLRLLGGPEDGLYRPARLQPTLRDGLALFEADRAPEILLAGHHEVRRLPEDPVAIVPGEPCHHPGAPDRALQSALDVSAVCSGNRVDDRPIVGVLHGDRLWLRHPLAGHVHAHGIVLLSGHIGGGSRKSIRVCLS
jgi:hypothetical protein